MRDVNLLVSELATTREQAAVVTVAGLVIGHQPSFDTDWL
jgi:hypothetical protein